MINTEPYVELDSSLPDPKSRAGHSTEPHRHPKTILIQLDKMAAFCTTGRWQIQMQKPEGQITSELSSTVDNPPGTPQ